MNAKMNRRSLLAVIAACGGFSTSTAIAQVMTKIQVAQLITNVENGVDEFRDYLERRGDNAREAGNTQQAKERRSRRGKQPTESQKANAEKHKDELDDDLGDLNRSTNRLRRKFDATETWMETRAHMERVMDDARDVNQVVVRGNYGSEVARLWAMLRTRINELARAYGIQPMAV